MKITIFGLAGSGTSTIGKLLAHKTNYKFMSSGNMMRDWGRELGLSIYDFEDKIVKNDKSFDLKLDQKVAEFGQKNNNFVFESRLAWYFIPDSFKVFLSCSVQERYKRIAQREKKSYQEIHNKNEKRESELIQRYYDVYPDISFPPQEKDFDLVVHTDMLSPDRIVDIILQTIPGGKYM